MEKRNLGEQWAEKAEDGKMRMHKAVEPCTPMSCARCDVDDDSVCCRYQNKCGCKESPSFIIRDLGPVNEDGCLAEERTGLFPVIAGLDSEKCWIVRLNAGNVTITVIGETKQQAIDAWNKRV